MIWSVAGAALGVVTFHGHRGRAGNSAASLIGTTTLPLGKELLPLGKIWRTIAI
jgi:hypothetical protein